MRLRHKKGSEEAVANSSFCINILSSPINKDSNESFSEAIFGNDNPLMLELGMGKGQFIINNALKYPNINFIGVEKYATVVLKAIEKLKAINTPIKNLRYICDDVINLSKYFKDYSIDKIYLNFSDPWPKKRHEERRITHHKFLLSYEKLLKENGSIEFKTDNIDLFNFSLDEIDKSGFKLLAKTYDLHSDKVLNKDNIMTEYEDKFSKKGNQICKYIIVRKA